MAYRSLPSFGDLQVRGTLSALDETLVLEASGASGSIINISGTWTGTIVVEGSNDRFATNQNVTLWSPPIGFISAGVSTNGYYRLAAISGFTQVRARMSAFTSGSALVILSTSSGTATVAALSPNASSFKTSSSTNDGAGNAITSQVSGGQRALDIGIDVGGVQVDPRQIRSLTASDTVSIQALSATGLTVTGIVTTSFATTTAPNTVSAGETTNNRSYQTTYEVTLPNGGVEANVVLFRNPNGSGKKVYIRNITFSNTQGAGKSVTMRVYANPTVTANGTVLSVVSMNVGGGAVFPVILTNTSPTTSSRGTKLNVLAQTNEQGTMDYDWGLIVNANNSLLITGTGTANNIPMVLNVIWSEAT